MSNKIFLNIDSIVLHSTKHNDRREIEEGLRIVLEEYLSSQKSFRQADVNLFQTDLNLSLTSVSGRELGRAVGERITEIIAVDTQPTHKTDYSRSHGGENHE